MEDEGFSMTTSIEEMAWEYVAQHGRASIAVRKRIETTEIAGDRLSAQMWRAVAERVEAIVGSY
jgi:hypothetical protein